MKHNTNEWTKADFDRLDRLVDECQKEIRRQAVADIKDFETFSAILKSGDYSRLMLSYEEEDKLRREQEYLRDNYEL